MPRNMFAKNKPKSFEILGFLTSAAHLITWLAVATLAFAFFSWLQTFSNTYLVTGLELILPGNVLSLALLFWTVFKWKTSTGLVKVSSLTSSALFFFLSAGLLYSVRWVAVRT